MLLAIPEQGQGELQQRQVSRFFAYVIEDPLDQASLEGRPVAKRPNDRPMELVSGHLADDEGGVSQHAREPGVFQGLAEEVGAQREHHAQRAHGHPGPHSRSRPRIAG